ncbi:MAG: TRAP transporter small permease [Rhodobacteraceae bacterium]|nr:TRAP transporter small permease [Paracoccaceae bacterium]
MNGLRILEQSLCFCAFMVMAGALIYDVLKREITGSGAFGAPQVGVIGMIVVSYIGIGLASAAGSHYRPRFADRLLPPRFDQALSRIGDLGFAIFCAFMSYIAIEVTIESYDLNDVSPVLRNPIWPVQATIAAGFGLVAFRHLLFFAFPAVRPAPQEEGSELASHEEAEEIMHGHDAYDAELAVRKGRQP